MNPMPWHSFGLVLRNKTLCMQRIILLVTCLSISCFVSSSFAQGFRLAFHAGANMGKVEGKSFSDEFQLGYHIGIAPEIRISKKWGIQPELLFSQTNTTTSSEFKDIYKISLNELGDVKLNYLSIPLLVAYRPVSFFSFQVGPQFSILMNKHDTFLENSGNAFTKGDFSLVGGAQLNILRIRLYGRYGIGLYNINDIDNRDNWKSQSVQLGVGIAL